MEVMSWQKMTEFDDFNLLNDLNEELGWPQRVLTVTSTWPHSDLNDLTMTSMTSTTSMEVMSSQKMTEFDDFNILNDLNEE